MIAIDENRKEQDITELEFKELIMLKSLYPKVNKGEGWFGKEKAMKIMDQFIKNK